MADYTIREATPDDAQAVLDYLMQITAETDLHILMNRERVLSFTLEYEQDVIRQYGEADNHLFLIALAGDGVIGQLTAEGGIRDYNRHRVSLGITTAKAWRGKGVGTALLTHTINWARASGIIRRIELEAFVENTRAIALYQRLGFEVEGRRNRAFIKNGRFIDEYTMALLVD